MTKQTHVHQLKCSRVVLPALGAGHSVSCMSRPEDGWDFQFSQIQFMLCVREKPLFFCSSAATYLLLLLVVFVSFCLSLSVALRSNLRLILVSLLKERLAAFAPNSHGGVQKSIR